MSACPEVERRVRDGLGLLEALSMAPDVEVRNVLDTVAQAFGMRAARLRAELELVENAGAAAREAVDVMARRGVDLEGFDIVAARVPGQERQEPSGPQAPVEEGSLRAERHTVYDPVPGGAVERPSVATQARDHCRDVMVVGRDGGSLVISLRGVPLAEGDVVEHVESGGRAVVGSLRTGASPGVVLVGLRPVDGLARRRYVPALGEGDWLRVVAPERRGELSES